MAVIMVYTRFLSVFEQCITVLYFCENLSSYLNYRRIITYVIMKYFNFPPIVSLFFNTNYKVLSGFNSHLHGSNYGYVGTKKKEFSITQRASILILIQGINSIGYFWR